MSIAFDSSDSFTLVWNLTFLRDIALNDKCLSSMIDDQSQQSMPNAVLIKQRLIIIGMLTEMTKALIERQLYCIFSVPSFLIFRFQFDKSLMALHKDRLVPKTVYTRAAVTSTQTCTQLVSTLYTGHVLGPASE